MARKRKFGRPVSGVLVLDKPPGVTSNQALQRAKRLFFANKAGHTGSLDPLATGVLPICFGEATKFSQFLLNSDKGYRSTFKLGVATSTADREGEVVAQLSAEHITLDDVERALQPLRGDILQVPPMVSALKVNGQPLYKLARAGVEVEREPRPVTVRSLQLLDFRPGEVAEVDVDILCSKGTYVRSLAADVGEMLKVGGHVATLHRSQAGAFGESDSISLDALQAVRGEGPAECLDRFLMPVQDAMPELPELTIDSQSGHYFRHGQPIMDTRVYRLGGQGDTVRVCQEDGIFLGIAEITDDGCIAPRRVVVL